MSDRWSANNTFFSALRGGFPMCKLQSNKKDVTTQTDVDILYMMDNRVDTEICSPEQDSDVMTDDSGEIGVCSPMNQDFAQKSGDFTQEGPSTQKDQMSDIGDDKSVEDDYKSCTSTEEERSSSTLKEQTGAQREYAPSTSQGIKHCELHCRCNTAESAIISNNEKDIRKWNQRMTQVQEQLLYEIAACNISTNEMEALKAIVKEVVKMLMLPPYSYLK